jgi:hypothetical protein
MAFLLSLSLSQWLIGLVLAIPLLLAVWGLYRLRTAITPQIQQAYLLSNYAAAVQLSNLRGEQSLLVVRLLIHLQLIQLYVALQALILWRSVPVVVMVGGVGLAGWLSYKWIDSTVNKSFAKWNTAAFYDAQPVRHRRAWGLLGHALLWGTFCLIFIVAILREYSL